MADLYVSALGAPYRALAASPSGQLSFVRLGDRSDDEFALDPDVWVDPDIVVDNLPHATFGGSDAQLQAAIELLQKQNVEVARRNVSRSQASEAEIRKVAVTGGSICTRHQRTVDAGHDTGKKRTGLRKGNDDGLGGSSLGHGDSRAWGGLSRSSYARGFNVYQMPQQRVLLHSSNMIAAMQRKLNRPKQKGRPNRAAFFILRGCAFKP